MAPVFDWLHSAVGKFREFAYAEEKGRGARPRVGLALSGGFARGIAHIGVLRALEQARIPIDCISGTSSGSLIATGYAAGVPLEEMERVAADTSFADFGRYTPSWLGLATNKRLEGYLARMTPATTFEEMRIPLAISATDLKQGIAVYYTAGPLAPVLRGSCAYPGLFVPIEYDGRKLVDGFLTAPVPVEGAALLGADIVIAIYLEAGSVSEPRTVADVISRSFTIIQRHADIGWRQSADVIIEPEVKHFVWDDFSKWADLIAAGEVAAARALPKIREALVEKVERRVS